MALAYHKTSPGQPLEISLGMAGKPTYVGAAVAKVSRTRSLSAVGTMYRDIIFPGTQIL